MKMNHKMFASRLSLIVLTVTRIDAMGIRTSVAASPTERAARELADYVRQLTGVALPVVTNACRGIDGVKLERSDW